jgi:4-aminobutyrate aminotransferase
VACAAAVATIRVMTEEDMLGNAQVRGAQLTSRLKEIQHEYPVIGDVRGLGLMIGVEFRTPDRKPDKARTKAVIKACLDKKLLLLSCGTHDNVIRWIPPLIVNDQQIEEAVKIFESALAETNP